MRKHRKVWLLVLSFAFAATSAVAGTWSWEAPHAEVTPEGDLEWKPLPFTFEAGDSPRYIDYAGGDDDNPGTRASPWKHHPWDAEATGNAAACEGVHTYVFKSGVVYRGKLTADESGEPGNPIRLTADPSWGNGEAAIYASERIDGGWRRCRREDAPAGMPEPQKVWYVDIGTDFTPRGLWETGGDEPTRIPIAREPDWTITNPDDPQLNWFVFTGRQDGWSIDEEHLTQPDPDYYVGATVWNEYSGNMGTVHRRKVTEYDPDRHAIRGTNGSRGNRYFLENLPQFLDQPGEYYFAEEGPHAGRLYVRLPADRNPNGTVLEAARRLYSIEIHHQQDIEISGLRFSFGNVPAETGWPTVAHLPAAIRLVGDCRDIRVSHCRFYHVPSAVVAFSRLDEQFSEIYTPELLGAPYDDVMTDIVVSDNDIAYTDDRGIVFSDGDQLTRWQGFELGSLFRVSVLRNRLNHIGRRQLSGPHAHISAISIAHGQLVEVAGNILNRCWGSGINCFNGKGGNDLRERPLIRVLVHHNKVTHSMLAANDYGGIESWQGGPAYIYNNISGNCIGHKHGATGGWGHGLTTWAYAFYLDGQFKSYTFNNIAWGKHSAPDHPYANRGAFLQVIGFMNHWFNNTAYNTVIGSHRGGSLRAIYLANLYLNMGTHFFLHRHTPCEDMPQQGYAANVFFGDPNEFGQFCRGGGGGTLEQFRERLCAMGPYACQTGWKAEEPPTRNAADHDFRPTADSAAIDRGVRYFVPWGLHMTVGEWNFYRHPADPTVIVGENMFMSDEYVTRHQYYDVPRNDLTAHGVTLESFTAGALEDWTEGALRFDGSSVYCVLPDEKLKSDYHYSIGIPEDAQRSEEGDFVYPGEKRRTVDMDSNNFLIEAYFRTDPGHAGGTLVSKLANAGYALRVNERGGVTFSLHAGDTSDSVGSEVSINDGEWHHVVAEADRANAALTLYVDGERAGHSEIRNLKPDTSLSNTADFLVGRGSDGDGFAGALDFLRVSRGTLGDAETTIEELYDWQFDGPFLKDFFGREPAGATRDAGAIEYVPAD